MKIELLKEPFLEFGNDFICDDPKMGISVGSFFSNTNKTHRSELHYGIIGTNTNIENSIEWINQFENSIEAKEKVFTNVSESLIIDGEIADEIFDMHNDKSLFKELGEQAYQTIRDQIKNPDHQVEEENHSVINKRLNPDFPGFNENHPFYCKFINDEANNIPIKESSVKSILEDEEIKEFDKVVRICDLYIESYKFLVNKSVAKPDVIFIIISSKVYKKLSSVFYQFGKYFNLRRYLKAQLITLPNAIPVQIILEDTIRSTKKSLQDLSMQAWNFCIANYYKNNGTPWTLTLKDKHTCFIGISFHKILDSNSNNMRSSVAQAFNYEGKGIIFVGEQFEWDSHKTNTPAPHLSYDYAKNLIKKVIEEYKVYNKNIPPNRVVIHKTTDFWDSNIHSDYSEVEGLKDGIKEILDDNVEIDLVTIKSAKIKLLRKDGDYPVIRGTLMHLDDATGILYSTGYTPYYETFPSSHIPHPLEVSIYEAESTLKKICEEILALTKMNFNNCNYYNSLPITIQFAQKVGEITQYINEGTTPPNKYYYYM